MRVPSLFPVLIMAALSGACYRYEPTTRTPTTVGTDVRVHLTEEGSLAVAATLGASIASLDGGVAADSGDALRFTIVRTRTRADREVAWTGEEVSVPRSAIARIERRTLDKWKTIRTAIMYGVGVVALSAGIKAIAAGAGGTSGGPPPPPL